MNLHKLKFFEHLKLLLEGLQRLVFDVNKDYFQHLYSFEREDH